MDVGRRSSRLIIGVIFVIVTSLAGVHSGRALLAEDFADANHPATYPSMYMKAKDTMACWLERLATGSSPKGPGH
ncbi:hypothetical protein RJ639_003276 [Escallonia herrerae]|uniref:Uncharacterized protein n=1 Tax=Escallonia herrerae TaxID=1293975 RepID=A0AA88W1Q5_9ASTE|nr:hypothetical protein RJ639_003276 [Escallonia herrerae]